MDIVILSGSDGDWTALYKDGVRVEQNHSISLRQGLEALGIPFEDREVEPEGVTDEFGTDPSFWTGREFPEAL